MGNIPPTNGAVIYSTSFGGSVGRKTETMHSILQNKKGKSRVVFLDFDDKEKQKVSEKSGTKGIYPLLFLGEEFIGDLPTIEQLDQENMLDNKLHI